MLFMPLSGAGCEKIKATITAHVNDISTDWREKSYVKDKQNKTKMRVLKVKVTQKGEKIKPRDGTLAVAMSLEAGTLFTAGTKLGFSAKMASTSI